jgi:hypothetical protein
MGEEASSGNDVIWIVELEQEGFARLERSESAVAAGLPEVHFIEVRAVPQEAVPVPVRYGNKGPHGRESSRLQQVANDDRDRLMPSERPKESVSHEYTTETHYPSRQIYEGDPPMTLTRSPRFLTG